MGNHLFAKTEEDEEDDSLSIEINLPKSCYYPGEKLSGYIILQAKSTKVPPIFNFSKSKIYFNQYQKFPCYLQNILSNREDNQTLFLKTHDFKKYKNRTILSPLKIFFSLKIPVNTYPSLIHTNSIFIKHYLTIEFPKIEKKKSVGIIIQNRQRFTVENKLFKSPVEQFKDRIKTSFLIKNSKLAFLLKSEKNSYAYNELIPFEIVINYTEFDMDIRNLRVSLTRTLCFNKDNNIDVKPIIYKDYQMPEKSKESNDIFQIYGYFSIPLISDYFSVNPMNIYNFYSNKIIDKMDKKFNSMYLYPSIDSDYLSCVYSLDLEIAFMSPLIKNEYLSIPIELYTPLKINEEVEEEEENECDEININNINNDVKENLYDKPTINKEQIKKGLEDNNDFELLNKNDFYKVLFGEK